jgi:HSP20 family molecular chaperone IbpA
MFEKCRNVLIDKRSETMSEKELTISKGNAGDVDAAGNRKIDNWLTPAVDIFENEAALTLVADLPGVPKDRLNLGIDKGVLTIEALAPTVAAEGTLFREFGATGYYRRFQLPDTLEFDKVAADLKDGVLTVRMPKAAKARPRKIEVTVH